VEIERERQTLSTKSDPIQVFISLGSNLAPEQNLPRAVKMLKQNYHLRIDGLSRVYESAPINARGEIAAGPAAFSQRGGAGPIGRLLRPAAFEIPRAALHRTVPGPRAPRR